MDNLDSVYAQLNSLLESDDKQQILDFLKQESPKHNDPYLVFVYASELAQEQAYDLALKQFESLVSQFPAFHIGRFQYAFLLITTDNISHAVTHLSALQHECEIDYLRSFAEGLLRLIEGNLDQAKELLLSGIQLNTENPSLNDNIKKVIIDVWESELPSETNQSSSESGVTEKAQSAMLDIYSKRF